MFIKDLDGIAWNVNALQGIKIKTVELQATGGWKAPTEGIELPTIYEIIGWPPEATQACICFYRCSSKDEAERTHHKLLKKLGTIDVRFLAQGE